MDEAVAGHATLIEMSPGARQRAHGPRQRPRHPRRPAPQIPQKIRAGGHPHHAAFRRQILRQGLCHLRRPARRRLLGRQRAVQQPSPPRSRATKPSTARNSPRASPPRKLIEVGPVQNRRGTTIRFVPDTEIFGDTAILPRPALQTLPLESLSVPRRAHQMVLRPRPAEGRFGHARRPPNCISPAACAIRWRPISASRRKSCPKSGPAKPNCPRRQRQQPGQARMGLRLDRARRFPPRHLLQHRPHPARRHA